MSRYLIAAAVLLVPFATVAAQPDEGPPRWAANLARKQHIIMNGLPQAYAGVRDPLPNSREKLSRGAGVFERNCASCHGLNGLGSGPEAFALVPAPADLAWLRNAPKARSEPYTYWAIAEGGQQFDSDMPAFKGRLSKKDMWSVIAYIRAGTPQRTP